MSDDLDFADLLYEIEAEFEEIIAELFAELDLPEMKQALAMKWATMPDELKEQVKEEYPEIYKQIMGIVQTGGY
jgi:hypothetical protein